jgi:phosphoesterase RecJ-like protein
MTDASPSIAWDQLKAILDRHHDYLLTSHVRPDCDALGSELAMAGILDALGKKVRIVNADSTPPRLAFVDPRQRIEVLHRNVDPDELTRVEVILVLDTGAWGQLGSMAEVIRNTSARVVVIDHHANEGELKGDIFQDERAEATGRLVADLARFLKVEISPEMARTLFAAIATDTGWFRFPSTDGSTYRVVADLVDAGARPHEIYQQLYENDSLSRAHLRGRVLSRIVTELDGRLAHTFVRESDFGQTGARRSETEDFINMALAIEGTDVAVMLTEYPVGTVKVSFRSRTSIDCSRVAATFQGGGHKAAAGATLQGTLEEVRTRVLDAVRAAML